MKKGGYVGEEGVAYRSAAKCKWLLLSAGRRESFSLSTSTVRYKQDYTSSLTTVYLFSALDRAGLLSFRLSLPLSPPLARASLVDVIPGSAASHRIASHPLWPSKLAAPVTLDG